jgi:hypothetical protein
MTYHFERKTAGNITYIKDGAEQFRKRSNKKMVDLLEITLHIKKQDEIALVHNQGFPITSPNPEQFLV